jgi:cytidine deaminase
MKNFPRSLVMKLCSRSTHRQHRHAALVFSGGAIKAMGYNHGEIHAEVHALKKLWPDHRKGATVYSFRFTKAGKMAMAKPCAECEKFMRENDVKVVYYSVSNGGMERMKL